MSKSALHSRVKLNAFFRKTGLPFVWETTLVSHWVRDISGKYLLMVLRKTQSSGIFQMFQAKHFTYEYKRCHSWGQFPPCKKFIILLPTATIFSPLYVESRSEVEKTEMGSLIYGRPMGTSMWLQGQGCGREITTGKSSVGATVAKYIIATIPSI